MTDKPKLFNKDEWLTSLKQKYSGKNIPVQAAHNERIKLEKKYGEKIITGKLEDMETDEEKADFIEYEVLGKKLSKVVPGYKEGEDLMKKGYKMQEVTGSLFTKGKKLFWIILGILIILAVIKYLLS